MAPSPSRTFFLSEHGGEAPQWAHQGACVPQKTGCNVPSRTQPRSVHLALLTVSGPFPEDKQLEKRLQLLQSLLKQGYRALDWLSCTHVDSGVAQRFQGKLRSAGFEKAKIFFNRASFAAKNALGKSHRGGQSSGVFVNIKGVVKMRNPQAFEIERGID